MEKDKCSITVEISLNDIIWMMDNPDKLDFWEKMWIDDFVKEFTKLWKEKVNENQIQKVQEVFQNGQI